MSLANSPVPPTLPRNFLAQELRCSSDIPRAYVQQTERRTNITIVVLSLMVLLFFVLWITTSINITRNERRSSNRDTNEQPF